MTTPIVERPTAVIVGASGDIGRASADALSASHALWLVGRDQARLDKLAAGFPAASVWTCDFETSAELAPGPPEALARVDVLVLAAGTWSAGPVNELTDHELRRVFAVNFFGPVALTRALLPAVRAARGHVIVINSTAVYGPAKERAAYAASKAALRSYTSALHDEEHSNGVRVSGLYLGRTATAMQRRVRESEGSEYQAKDYMAPEAVAQVIGTLVESPSDLEIGELTVRPMRPTTLLA